MRPPTWALSAALRGFVAATPVAQHPLQLDDNAVDYSNVVLAALHGLGRSWSQAYAPNGMAIVPATVAVGTLLYHVGPLPNPPSSGMEWFAFDSEHSYLFSRLSGESKGTAQYIFAATRPLRLLMFDGFSAAKMTAGTLDLQDMLAYRKVGNTPFSRDFARSQELCNWGSKYDIDGFIREEATFEIIYCDFGKGVRLVDTTRTSINITAPSHEMWKDESPRYPPPPPDGPRGPRRPPASDTVSAPYRDQSRWSMLHAASWHHRTPDTRFRPHPAYTVSLYDRRYTSLNKAFAKPTRKHRLHDISQGDIQTWIDEIESMIVRWNQESREGRVESSGMDWSAIAQALVDRNADRLSELRSALRSYTSDSQSATAALNTTAALSHVRLISFALVMPYLDAPSTLSPIATSATRKSAVAPALEKCTHAFTRYTPEGGFSPQELRLKDAVEGVLRRVCSFSLDVLVSALDTLDAQAVSGNHGETTATMRAWLGELDDLMTWLAWPVWMRCETLCDWDEQCYIPMWPIGMHGTPPNGGPTEEEREEELLHPRCIKMPNLISGMK